VGSSGDSFLLWLGEQPRTPELQRQLAE